VSAIAQPWSLLLLLVAATVAAPAEAADRFALLVGHDAGGPGQQRLAYSHSDVERLEAVLGRIGGFDRVRKLENPKGRELAEALDQLARDTADARDNGASPLVVFYYSGHARGSALSLGPEDVDLDWLRARLERIPAALKVVILDACQSGEFSSVKGAIPAAEFAVSSTERLGMEGLAVLASSTGSELSQESERIRGSFFTHHLTSGLWGPADANEDGRVSLEEAYRYAYRETVLSTAETRVGRQHPTLELAVRGHGQLVLTEPRASRSMLHIPAGVAESVVIATPKGSIWAEVETSRDEGSALALPEGEYLLLLRRRDEVHRCSTSLAEGQIVDVDLADCQRVEGGGGLPKQREPFWRDLSFEAGVGSGSIRGDPYVLRLLDFGYRGGHTLTLFYRVNAGYEINEWFEVQLNFQQLADTAFVQSTPTNRGVASWSAHGLTASARGSLPLFGGWFVPYVQAGAGLAWARTDINAQVEHQFGPQLEAAGGLRFMFGDHVGLFLQTGWTHARVIDNLFGETHDVGGIRGFLGMRAAL
jgi:hypothetical protein